MNINTLNTKLKNALRIDKALKFVWKASPHYAVLSGIIIVVSGLLPLLSLYLLKLIIDAVTSLVSNTGQILPDKDFSDIYIYIGFSCCVGLLISFFNFLSDYLKKAQAQTIADYMFRVLHKKSSEADLEYYESPEYRDTLHRAQQEGPYRPASIVQGLFAAGQSATSFAAIFWLLFIFNPVLPIIMIVVSIPGVLMRLRYAEKIYSWQQKRTEDERKSHYFNYMLTGDLHAKEFRLFNLGTHFITKFNVIRKRLKDEKLRLEKRRAFGDFIAQSSVTLAVFGSLVYVAHQTIEGVITLGALVMYFQAFQRGIGYLKTLLESGAGMYEDNLFLSNFYDFLQLKPKIQSPEFPRSVPKTITQGIKFENVNFNYPGCEKKLLNCINFSIAPGEVVALVGENGSGKSTIVKLLSRLYDPQSGNIFLEDINIKDFKINAYRKFISVVFQDHIHYHLSAGENITMGDTDKKSNIAEMEKAARQSGAEKKILELPNQYDTILGRWFKGGEELSVGQWQMLSIARAFFRNAHLIILDEPSSALDPETEMKIFSRLKELIKGRSALIISHRYSTVKMADKIMVLDKGQIIEQGSHEELIRLKGKYAGSYQLQAKSYTSSN